MHSIIQVDNVGKQYRLGTIGTGSLHHDVNRWWHRLRGKEDPYLQIGEANERSTKGSSEYVWALRDISFTVQPGEVLGIIGRNGAGKSTLLKILSRITTPSTGSIKLGGRVASLLEVGTGMHPDLTGRENIYLNGAILGMRKKEIDRKLDAIVDFAGVERYLDTPVKRYSSGMHVRLGFAVAAHLEPDILIVDEVLAVGDAEFQEKCLGKMQDVSREEGRTVLFVSHNMAAVKNLCTNSILLQQGKVIRNGPANEVVNEYLLNTKNVKLRWIRQEKNSSPVGFRNIELKVFANSSGIYLVVDLELVINVNAKPFFVAVNVSSIDGTPIFQAIPQEGTLISVNEINPRRTLSFQLHTPYLIPGHYMASFWVGPSYGETYDWQENIISFEVVNAPNAVRTHPYSSRNGYMSIPAEWKSI